MSQSPPPSQSRVFKLGELYSGPGGVGMGAALAEFVANGIRYSTEPVWVNDYDHDSLQTWRHNVEAYYRQHKGFQGQVQVLEGDVRKLDIDSLPPVDGLMFGFPCNDFSLVGEHKGINGHFGPLYSYGVRVLEGRGKPKNQRPQWFLAENVSGITSSNEGKAFGLILDSMRAAGYRLSAHKYRLEEYGVPQARHRVIVIGLREDLDLRFQVPKPLGRTLTAHDALVGNPIPAWATNQETTRQSARVVERLQHIRPGQNAWTADLPPHLKLNVEKTQLSHIYKRLDPAKPAYTVTGSGGGGTHMYHWLEPRALTNRERARLQTFPDDFEFKGSKESVRKQIGMAIPVQASKLLVECILKTFAGVDYASIPANIASDFEQV